VIVLTAPWWVTVVLRHGALPLLASGGSTWSLFGPLQLLTLTISGEPFFPVLGVLALVGALLCLRAHSYWLPVWLLLMVAVDSRSPLASATVPLALLAGIGAADGVLPWLARSPTSRPAPGGGDVRAGASLTAARFAPGLFLATVAAVALVLGTLNASVDEHGVLMGLTREQRAAMRWVAEHTAPASSYLVVTGSQFPTRDRVAEWFPALAERVSVNTIQGYEWVAGGAFAGRVARYAAIQHCAYRDAACVEAWGREHDVRFTHVFLPKGPTGASSSPPLAEDCCWALRSALRTAAGYAVVYDGPGATVLRRDEP
jgi:hypothetical protein